MEKRELMPGMVVKTKDGKRYLVAVINRMECLIGKEDAILLSSYTEDMECMHPDSDIVEVYEQAIRPMQDILDMVGEPIWERKEKVKEITAEEAFRTLREHYGCSVRIMEE